MKKQLLEDIRRIKTLMSLIVEDVNAECIEGNCIDGRGTLKIPALDDDNVFDFETPSEKIIKGNFKDNKPINGEDYIVTFKTYLGTATYDGQMNDAFGMYGYGRLQLPNEDNPDEEPACTSSPRMCGEVKYSSREPNTHDDSTRVVQVM